MCFQNSLIYLCTFSGGTLRSSISAAHPMGPFSDIHSLLRGANVDEIKKSCEIHPPMCLTSFFELLFCLLTEYNPPSTFDYFSHTFGDP